MSRDLEDVEELMESLPKDSIFKKQIAEILEKEVKPVRRIRGQTDLVYFIDDHAFSKKGD